MDRINKTGKLLIDYKREYMKHYSPIVDLSLETSVNNLVEKKTCDENIAAQILDDNVPLKNFEIAVMSHREFLKTLKELAEEFDKLRGLVNLALAKQGFTRFVETENNIENDSITIIKQYSITPEFIKVYFGLTEDEMPAVMKKRGFAEKFAVLRLSKIFKEIVSEIKVENTGFSQGFSKVYYNQSIDGFSVDYRYHINVNTITEESIGSIVKKIQDLDRVVEKKFNIKTGLKFYNLQPIELKRNDNITQPPKNKSKEETINSKELEEIQNQLISANEESKEQVPDKVEEKIEKPVEEKPVEVKDDIKQDTKKDSENNQRKDKNQEKNNKKDFKEEKPKVEEIKEPSPLEIKDDDISPFADTKDNEILIDDKEIDDTAVYEEEANNVKVEVDTSDDFLDGFIPQQVFSMGGDDDVPGDDDFGTMNAPDEEDIDFT